MKMPHIVIKTIKGKSKEQLKDAAEQVSAVINKTMGKPEKYISVAVEEYAFDEWKGVYNESIRDNENVLVKPGYTNPKTFE
jgi:4-oxalocrotonate tautomerase family enzyme